jgi:hypothetical protein
VATYLSALDTLHGCKSGILLTTRGQGHNGQFHITILSTFPVLPGSGGVDKVESESEWPCPDCSTLEAHLYGGCIVHDYAIGEAYRQKKLPGV